MDITRMSPPVHLTLIITIGYGAHSSVTKWEWLSHVGLAKSSLVDCQLLKDPPLCTLKCLHGRSFTVAGKILFPPKARLSCLSCRLGKDIAVVRIYPQHTPRPVILYNGNWDVRTSPLSSFMLFSPRIQSPHSQSISLSMTVHQHSWISTWLNMIGKTMGAILVNLEWTGILQAELWAPKVSVAMAIGTTHSLDFNSFSTVHSWHMYSMCLFRKMKIVIQIKCIYGRDGEVGQVNGISW